LIVLQALALAGGEMISRPIRASKLFVNKSVDWRGKYQTASSTATLAANVPQHAANAGSALRGLVGEAAARIF
jgi:hypothetical protein